MTELKILAYIVIGQRTGGFMAAAANDVILIEQPASIQNLDVLDLVGRIDRAVTELHGSVSSTRNQSTSDDIIRWRAIRDDISRKFEIYRAAPELDLPKYHPRARPLPTPPELGIRQNPDVMSQIQMLIALRTEMVYGEAAERTSAFSDAQALRIEKVLTKWGDILDDVEANPEVDSPNSPDEKPTL